MRQYIIQALAPHVYKRRLLNERWHFGNLRLRQTGKQHGRGLLRLVNLELADFVPTVAGNGR